MLAVAKFHEDSFASGWRVTAGCFRCGRPTEGRVANCRVDANRSEEIAKQWAKQLNSGEAILVCPECRREEKRAS